MLLLTVFCKAENNEQENAAVKTDEAKSVSTHDYAKGSKYPHNFKNVFIAPGTFSTRTFWSLPVRKASRMQPSHNV